MKKVPLLALLGLLIAGPVSAQANTNIVHFDTGPWGPWEVDNPCTPGEMIPVFWYAKGHTKWTANDQGSHYVRNVQYTGEGVGSADGLVYTLHNPWRRQRFSSLHNDVFIFKYKDDATLNGKGEGGLEQIIEVTVERELHILPDGTTVRDIPLTASSVCKKG